ncbi:uncharacterized protein LOC121859841 isoform X2 [Homarus americanus]|nr:uncharacterized protein LOC121859841 isoform X2 [Homarus americanus]
MLWWVMVVMVWLVGDVTARESRKEANLLDESYAHNLDHMQQQQGQHDAGESNIVMDYDYFMHGLRQVGALPYSDLDRVHSRPESNTPRNPYLSQDNIAAAPDMPHYDDYFSYNYKQDEEKHGSSYPSEGDSVSYDSTGHQEQTFINHDPFSVFYDSMFPKMDSIIPVEETKTISENMSRRPPSTTVTPRPSLPPTVLTPTRPTQAPSVIHSRPQPSPSPADLAGNSLNTTRLTHLKAMMPTLLEKFGLPKSLGDQLFRDDAALLNTLVHIIQDENVREAMSMVPQLDLTSFPKMLSSLDPTRVVKLLRGTDLSKVMDLVKSLGIDTSYITGVFNRGGAAAQHGNQESDGDGKFIFLPLLDTDSVNNVQSLGFVIILFFLLTTAFAYLENDIFETDGLGTYVESESQHLNQEMMGWGDTRHHLLPAVEAAETSPDHRYTPSPDHHHELPYRAQPYPTLKVPGVSRRATSRPFYLKTQQAYARPTQKHWGLHPATQHTIQLRQHPKPRYRTRSHLDLSPHYLHRPTRPQPSARPLKPAEHIDRRHYTSSEDDYLYDAEHTYENDYVHREYEPSQVEEWEAKRHPNHQYHTETSRAKENDDYYTFYSPSLIPTTWRPLPPTISSSTTFTTGRATIPTTLVPETRPTSKYASTIRSSLEEYRKTRTNRPSSTPHH